MALSEDQKKRFYMAAKAKGLDDATIQQEIVRKDTELSATQPKPAAYNSNITPQVAAGANQNFGQKAINFVGDALFPTVKKVGLEIDTNRRMKPALEATNNLVEQTAIAAQQLTAEAQKETDPVKKQALLKRAQQISAEGQQAPAATAELGFKESGMTEKDLAGLSTNPTATALNQGMGAAGEVGSWFVPGGSTKGMSSGQKIKFGLALSRLIADLSQTKWRTVFIEGADVVDSIQMIPNFQISVERVDKTKTGLVVEIMKEFPIDDML
jgi:hypothetical protein